MKTKKISIVLPVFNEANSLPLLWQRLDAVIKQSAYPFEVIFVDDGSHDQTTEILYDIQNKNAGVVKFVRLSRNFGHQQALTCGIESALGQAVILMDADLQDTPEALPNLIAKWEEGFEVVYAIRTDRKEFFIKRWAFSAFYRLQAKMIEIKLPLDAGIFSIMDKKVVDQLKSMGERNRYLPGLRGFTGFKQTGIKIERGARHAGEPKVSLAKLFKLAMDGIFSMSYVPLRLANYLGLCIASGSFVIALWALYTKFFTDQASPGWSSNLAGTFFIGGVQLVFLGILGEYLGRIYDEVKGRPYYIIDQKVGFEEDHAS
ncbi:MAG: glycosyltransferase [Candidatus Lambdaproteobacteria bacterium RIFOXYD12_FULL_49_8]|uniref:Glycosyltransferase n=1 Tax=Candidatus Lambdaproteobacteria bacterium RIFOXYD2_FULL_50_16 TaxID=1817772 RepID=A0A1F6G550_9PROT|nr:MAG: glycosyltransferase [Candidatus Lambdaproteobacteria bacterium RIFOXYD2_FULL_50_16]OGG97984.1 MAG: glycosyltransferase [Candidatus Lambdaproteobacteria bacterium RIFOXYD12_FULL_49_8]